MTKILAIRLNVVKIPINCWLICKCEIVTVNKVDPQICGMLPTASTIIIMILFLDLNRKIVIFYTEIRSEKNPQFNFSSQNFSIERNFFK